jgi:hypothetical protein
LYAKIHFPGTGLAAGNWREGEGTLSMMPDGGRLGKEIRGEIDGCDDRRKRRYNESGGRISIPAGENP